MTIKLSDLPFIEEEETTGFKPVKLSSLPLIEEGTRFPGQSRPVSQETPQPTFAKSELGGFEEDVVGPIKEFGGRVSKRAQRVEALTELGTMARKATGTKGFLGDIVEDVASLPERTTRTLAGGVASAIDLATTPAEIAIKGINRSLGGVPGELLKWGVQAGVESKAGQKVIEATTKWWGSLSDTAKANYGTIPDVLEMIGLKGVSKGVGALGKGVTPLAKKVVEAPNKLLGRMADEFSGVAEETLRFAGTPKGRKALEAAATSKDKVYKNLNKMIDNFDEYVPEKAVIKKSLQNMPDMEMSNIIKKLDEVKILEGAQHAVAANNSLDKIKGLWLKLSTKNIPASKIVTAKGVPFRPASTKSVPIKAADFRTIRNQIDNEIKSVFTKDQGAASALEKALSKIRNEMKLELIRTAERSGNPQYVKAMKNYSDKLAILEDTKLFFGKTGAARKKGGQSSMANVFGKSKDEAQEVLDNIGKLFGQDFMKKAKLEKMASEIGKGGKADFFSRAGGPGGKFSVGALATLPASSPFLASKATLPLVTGAEKLTKGTLKGLGSPTAAVGGLRLTREEQEELEKFKLRR